MCCGFNYIPGERGKAIVLNQVGHLSGLKVLLSPPEGTPAKWFLLLNHPITYITPASQIHLLESNVENFFQVYASEFEPALQYDTLPLASRRCYLQKDAPNIPVLQSKCRLICMMKTYHRKCGCHPFTIPILDKSISIRNCTALDMLCIRNKIGKFSIQIKWRSNMSNIKSVMTIIELGV